MRLRIRDTIFRAYYRLKGYHPISIDNNKYLCDPYHHKFWRIVNKGKWEPQTFKVLDKYLTPESTYCDIGAWIGPTVIYAAKRCKQVYCFEPDTIAYRFLLWNLALNKLKNVLPNNIALSDKNSIETISSLGTELGDSMTSMLGDKNNESIDIFCMTWQSWSDLVKPNKIDLLKIDIEGAEFDFLPSIKDYLASNKPVIYLSLHAPFLDASVRKEKLKIIVTTLHIYSHCYNENFEEINIETLLSEDNQNNFGAFIFKD